MQIKPLFNRGVIMVTDDHTFHRCLFPGVTRKSIATYAYEKVEAGSHVARTAGGRPEGSALKKWLAALQHYAVKLEQVGSATAKIADRRPVPTNPSAPRRRRPRRPRLRLNQPSMQEPT